VSDQNYMYVEAGGSQTLALFTENSEVCDQLEITYVMSIASTVGVNTDFVTTNFVDGAAFSGSNLEVSWITSDVRPATTLTITITATITAVTTFT